MIHKILALFVNTLTVDEKRYLLTRGKLTQTIEIQLSQNQKIFFELFFAVLKTLLHFKHLPKKLTLIADLLPEIQASKNMVR